MKHIVLALLAGVAFATPVSGAAPQYGTYGIDTGGMDRNVRPGDDFFHYMNGGWAAKTAIPADRADYGVFAELDDLSKARTRDILDDMAKDGESRPGIAYRSYLDKEAVEGRGLDPIRPWLAVVQSLTRENYPQILGQAARARVRTPFPFYIGQNDKKPDTYILSLMQGGLGMPDRDYYLSEKVRNADIRDAYLRHLEKMLGFAGVTDAADRAKAVLALEKKIAEVHWTRAESRDAERTYNPRTIRQLQHEAPGFAFPAMFGAAGLGLTDLLVVQPSAVSGIADILDGAAIGVLRDQLLVRSLEAYADYLPEAVAEENFAFYGTVLSGTPERRPRWKRAVDFAVGVVPDDVGRVYVARHFPPQTKEKMETLVADVIHAMGRRIEGLSWMAPATKAEAQRKLVNFTAKIGYPDRWRDYSGLTLAPDDLFGNAWRSNLFDFDYEAAKLGGPVRRWEWFMTPMTINAYANFGMNEIVFPAAILQPPFFDPDVDPAVNYGAIGAVIGHEISHHFDDQGSKYDAEGTLRSWWTPQDRQAFEALTAKLVQQYNAYEPFPGEHVNGKLTLGENIGDLAGVAVALDAYLDSLGGTSAPVLDGTTGVQRFFMSWGQVWRRKHRDEDLRRRLLTDPHAPAQYRADIVRNFDAWYEAFGKEAEGRLALPADERVRVW